MIHPPLPVKVVAGRLGDLLSVRQNVLYPPYKSFCVWHSNLPATFRCTADSKTGRGYYTVIVKNGKIVRVDETDFDHDLGQ